MISVLHLLLLTSLVRGLNLDVSITVAGIVPNSLALDASRTHASLYHASNSTFIDTFHADFANVFHVEGLGEDADYLLCFHSQDLLFAVSSQFIVDIAPDATSPSGAAVSVRQYLPGLHTELQKKLPHAVAQAADTPNAATSVVLDGALFNIRPPHYRHKDSTPGLSGLLGSIPGLSFIFSNKWITMAFVSIVSLALAPSILTKLDPSFADRIVKAQQEQMDMQKQNQ